MEMKISSSLLSICSLIIAFAPLSSFSQEAKTSDQIIQHAIDETQHNIAIWEAKREKLILERDALFKRVREMNKEAYELSSKIFDARLNVLVSQPDGNWLSRKIAAHYKSKLENYEQRAIELARMSIEELNKVRDSQEYSDLTASIESTERQINELKKTMNDLKGKLVVARIDELSVKHKLNCF